MDLCLSFSSSLVMVNITILKITVTTNWWAALLIKVSKRRILTLPAELTL